jgi:nucleoside-diphosphate-sugar epimerase
MANNNIFVTGADGFIGRAVCRGLGASWQISRGVRSPAEIPVKDNTIAIGDLGDDPNWQRILPRADYIVHLAGRAHIIDETNRSPLSAFRKINTQATKSLALAAAGKGVKRFIFVSSIGVYGNCTAHGGRYAENDTPNPHNDYALSKLEAENALLKIGAETGMEFVIIRPPPVYGPEVKANILRLIRIVDKGLPLPFGSLENIRSFLGLDNLVDFINVCLVHPSAANEIFNVADGQDISTIDLIGKIGEYLGKSPIVYPFPVSWLRFLCRVVGRGNDFTRIAEFLQVDISKAKNVLGWEPPKTIDQELAKTVQWFVEQKNR